MANATTRNDTFTQIARRELGIETLATRGRDALDFHDVGVAGLRSALDAAYRAGQEQVQDLLAAAQALLDAHDSQMLTADDWRRLRRATRRAHKSL